MVSLLNDDRRAIAEAAEASEGELGDVGQVGGAIGRSKPSIAGRHLPRTTNIHSSKASKV